MEVCKFDECDRKVSRLGYCNGHSQQYYQGRELVPLRPYKGKPNDRRKKIIWTWEDMLKSIDKEIAKKSP